MAMLSPIEIDIGRKVVSCSRIFRTHHNFLFCSTIMPSPPRLEGFHCPVRIPFRIYGKIWLLSPLDILCFSLLKCFESLANDRDSLFVFFVYSFHLKIAITVTPSNWGYRSKSLPGDAQTTSHLSIIIFNWTQRSHR